MAAAWLSDTATLVVFAAIIGFVEIGGRDRDDRMLRFATVVAIGLLFAEIAELAGLHAILGSFVAGMFLRGPLLEDRLGRDVNHLVRDPIMLKIGVEWLRRRGELAHTEAQRKDVIFMGAGAVAQLLAQHLGDSRAVRMVDRNPHRCAKARRAGLTTIHGDAMDEETLERAGTARAGAFVALHQEPTGPLQRKLERIGAAAPPQRHRHGSVGPRFPPDRPARRRADPVPARRPSPRR